MWLAVVMQQIATAVEEIAERNSKEDLVRGPEILAVSKSESYGDSTLRLEKLVIEGLNSNLNVSLHRGLRLYLFEVSLLSICNMLGWFLCHDFFDKSIWISDLDHPNKKLV